MMNSKEYRMALDALGLNQRTAGEFLGIGHRTSKEWAADGVRSQAAAMLLRHMVRKGFTTVEVVAIAAAPLKEAEIRCLSDTE